MNLTHEALLEKYLGQLNSISLDAMGKVKLMNRVDTKYLTTIPVLLRLFEMTRAEYFVQEIAGSRNMAYFTRYFDTEDCFMYHEHQRGRQTRQKVRIREYVASDLRFLEVKTKNNKGRTKKKRIRLCTPGYELAGNDEFLGRHTPWTTAHLKPRLENNFHRITLVNRDMTERLTIDTSLSFHNLRTGADHNLDGLVIIELKRDGNTPSPVLRILRDLRIKPHGFSKYCMGMAFTDNGLRLNRIKERLRDATRLCESVRRFPSGPERNNQPIK